MHNKVRYTRLTAVCLGKAVIFKWKFEFKNLIPAYVQSKWSRLSIIDLRSSCMLYRANWHTIWHPMRTRVFISWLVTPLAVASAKWSNSEQHPAFDFRVLLRIHVSRMRISVLASWWKRKMPWHISDDAVRQRAKRGGTIGCSLAPFSSSSCWEAFLRIMRNVPPVSSIFRHFPFDPGYRGVHPFLLARTRRYLLHRQARRNHSPTNCLSVVP